MQFPSIGKLELGQIIKELFHIQEKLNAMTLQISYGWIRYGDIDGYDEFGNPTGQIHSPQSQLFTLTSSFPLTHFRFGSTVKLATDKLSGEVGDRTAIALAFDWGFLGYPLALVMVLLSLQEILVP